MTKLYNATELLYNLTESYNRTDNKNLTQKSKWSCRDKTLSTLKFYNIALLIIEYKKKYL